MTLRNFRWINKVRILRLNGSVFPLSIFREKPVSLELSALVKNNPNIFWNPFPSVRCAGIDLTEQSIRQINIEDMMGKKMTPLPKISEEESASLTDLLSKNT